MKKTILALLVMATLSLAVPAGASAAPPPFFTQFGENSGKGVTCDPTTQFGVKCSAPGETEVPRGMAVDPATGNIYVAEQRNNRISEFSPWGVFIRAWGWGVEDGSPELQTCSPAHCQEGLPGDGPGQFEDPMGVAIDSVGNVYVQDHVNSRIVKFDPSAGPDEDEVEFLLSFGEPGTGDGQFSNWNLRYSPRLDIGPGDKVYVGDTGRIQRFDTAGNYVESIPLPGERVIALAVDDVSGNLYASYQGGGVDGEIVKPDVRKLSPAGVPLGTLKVASPRALAADPAGNVYVVDGEETFSEDPIVRKFTAAGAEVPDFAFTDVLEASTGIATGAACGVSGVDLFVSNLRFVNSYVRAYGPTPDPDLCPPPQVPPTISSQFVTSAGSDGATVKANINSNFWFDTTYFVQYGTGKCSEGGCTEEQPLAPGSKLTNSVTNQVLTTPGVFLDQLEPNTTYYYRFVAQSSGGGPVRGVGGVVGIDGAEGTFTTFPLPSAPRTDCPNQAFRIGASALLPDCRAFELVSPVDKNGGDVAIEPVVDSYGTLAESSADGNRATFSSLRAFGGPQSAPLVNQYLASRTTDGWMAHSISPPRRTPSIVGVSSKGRFKAFSEDLCSAWVLQDSDVALVPGAPAGVANLYQAHQCGTEPLYELLSTVVPPGFDDAEKVEYFYPTPLGFSADGSHTVFRAPAELTTNACATAGIYQTYVTSENGPLRLVSLLPGGNKASCSHSSAGTFLGNPDAFREASAFRAISTDASRVFWTDNGDTRPVLGTGSAGAGPGKLYVRLNATEAPSKVTAGQCTEPDKACTLAISTASDTLFRAADPAGTATLYTSGGELRRYEVETATPETLATGILGVVGASEDLSRVYFVSNLVLSGEQANSEGGKAQAGKPNLYLSEGGVETFIATLGAREGKGEGGAPGLASVAPLHRSSRVSPDGLHLAFTSAAPLTGYDNTDVASGKPDAEVFLYDAGGAGELRCVSCNPTGARPRGRKLVDLENGAFQYWAAARLPGWPTQMRPSRLLSADGDRLFFESFEALVPGDTNGRQDAYEWRRAGSAQACEQAGAGLYAPEAGGCLSLISSGKSPADSELIDVSGGARDVLIATGSSLLPQDPGLIDVYDARAGGGFPQPVKTAGCEGEACQGPYEPPQDPTPASSSFEGAGNVREAAPRKPRCAKPKVKRKGRCVAKKQKKGKSNRQRANQDRRAGR